MSSDIILANNDIKLQLHCERVDGDDSKFTVSLRKKKGGGGRSKGLDLTTKRH